VRSTSHPARTVAGDATDRARLATGVATLRHGDDAARLMAPPPQLLTPSQQPALRAQAQPVGLDKPFQRNPPRPRNQRGLQGPRGAWTSCAACCCWSPGPDRTMRQTLARAARTVAAARAAPAGRAGPAARPRREGEAREGVVDNGFLAGSRPQPRIRAGPPEGLPDNDEVRRCTLRRHGDQSSELLAGRLLSTAMPCLPLRLSLL
jgi:hypothetical protein